jgi:hypothetical protein
MNTRRWLITGCVLAMLAGLIVSTSVPPTLAEMPVSEHYRLVASDLGDVLVKMESDSYELNEGVVVQAEVAAPMESGNYRVGGIVGYWAYLPLALKGY